MNEIVLGPLVEQDIKDRVAELKRRRAPTIMDLAELRALQMMLAKSRSSSSLRKESNA